MNKDIFLSELRQALAGMPPHQQEEIIKDYQTHFEESAAQGRSEAETVHALGAPRQLAREHLYDMFHYDWHTQHHLLSLMKWLLVHAGMGFLLPVVNGIVGLVLLVFLSLVLVIAGALTGKASLIAAGSVVTMLIGLLLVGVIAYRLLFFRHDKLNAKGMYHGQDKNTVIERVIAWTPGNSMTIALPAEVSWKPAVESKAVIRCNPWLMEHIRLDSACLHGRFKWRFFHQNCLQVVLEGPAIQEWHVLGAGTLSLNDVAQPALQVYLNGSGDIRAAGRVDKVEAYINGSGDIDIGLLAQKHATADLTGSGDITLAPTESADLSVKGNGDIRLLTKPEKLNTRKTGGGDIRFADGSSV